MLWHGSQRFSILMNKLTQGNSIKYEEDWILSCKQITKGLTNFHFHKISWNRIKQINVSLTKDSKSLVSNECFRLL